MSGLPNSESLESWGWDSIERLLIGSMAGLGYLVKSLPTTDANRDAVGIAISSAQTTEGDPPTTTTTATLLGSVTLPLQTDALQEAGSLLKNIGTLTAGNLTAGEVCPPSPAGPAVPTIPAEVDSLEKLFVWSALTLNASLYPEALTYLQIIPSYGESLLSIQISWPLDSEVLALNGGNFIAAAQRLALTYAVLDGSTGSSGGVVLPPPVQYWGIPVADLAALGALLTQSPGMSRFVVDQHTFYTLLAELPDGESLDGLNFVAGQGDTVWRRVGEVGPAGPAGNDGSDGSPGADGQDGADGLSAYQIAVNNGFVGSEAQWLASLEGPAGEHGADGQDGADGLSAYQIAVNNGFVGSEAQWLASLEGPAGPAGLPGAGLDWRGAWNVATSYLENDAVSYLGSSWIANNANTGKTPGVDPEWDLWVAKGDPGADGQDGAGGGGTFDPLTDKALYYYDAGSGLFKPVGIGTEGQTLIAQPASNPPYQWAAPTGGGGGRELLTADRTYYVRTDGSDSNDGLSNTAGGAFLTIQKGIDALCSLDLGLYNCKVKVGSGTHDRKVNLKRYVSSGGKAILEGDPVTPANVVLNYTASTGGIDAILDADGGIASWQVGGFTFASTATNRFHIRAWNGAVINIDRPVVFLSTVGGVDIFLDNYGKCFISANYTINGARANHIFARVSSTFIVSGTFPITVTLANSCNFSSFFANVQRDSMVDYWGFTASGSATGVRYNVVANSTLFTNNSLASLPGNSNGTVASGGQAV